MYDELMDSGRTIPHRSSSKSDTLFLREIQTGDIQYFRYASTSSFYLSSS